MNSKCHIVIFKISNGDNIVKAYNKKHLFIPVEDNFSGEVRVNLHKGQLSKKYKKIITELYK